MLRFKTFLSTLSLRRATLTACAEISHKWISIHALLAESDHECPKTCEAFRPISIHALLAESDAHHFPALHDILISIHALLAESDTPARMSSRLLEISIHALLAESDKRANSFTHAPPQISIHALLAESDKHSTNPKNRKWNFYPRSPCGERQQWLQPSLLHMKTFLSTLSLRRATVATSYLLSVVVYFYPRSPCGERPDDLGTRLCDYCISIHALLAESDSVIFARA